MVVKVCCKVLLTVIVGVGHPCAKQESVNASPSITVDSPTKKEMEGIAVCK